MNTINEQSVLAIMKELGIDENDSKAKAIIERLLADRPNVQIDTQFVAQLRSQLAEQANAKTAAQPSTINFLQYFMNNKFVPAIVVLLVVALGGTWLLTGASSPLERRANQILSSKYAVSDTGSNAFGSLASLTSSGQGGDMRESGFGTGGGFPDAMPTSSPDKMMAGDAGAPADIAIMPPYNAEIYEFKYTGGELPELAVEQPVYRRDKGNIGTSILDRILRTITLGLVDLSSFQSTKLNNFSIIEDREFGYNIDVNIPNGAVSVFQNWEKWPQPWANCRDEACFQNNRVKESDIPQDSEAFAIAERFLDEKRISREGYGDPVINSEWRNYYARAEDKAGFYFPETIDIVYPLIIDGQPVLDEGGFPSGMHVNVDVRTKRVSSIYELTTRQFQKSGYAGETNGDRIIAIAERGGFRNYSYPAGRDAKVTTLEIDTPTVQMLRMWRYNQPNYAAEEIYVPALVFPIKNSPDYWRKNIIVPLVKDILDNETDEPPMTIMPMPAQDLPMPVEPDGGIGDTPSDNDGTSSSGGGSSAGNPGMEPAVSPRQQ